MRLRTITAADMQDAMRMVREEIGEDAVIISTSRNPRGKGVTLTVAQDSDTEDFAPAVVLGETPEGSLSEAAPAAAYSARSLPDYIVRDIEQILRFHGVVDEVSEALLSSLRTQPPLQDDSEESLATLLAHILSHAFRYQPLPYLKEGCRHILIGPPGAGKTLTAAKIAARTVQAGASLVLVNTDNKKAGAVEQLAAYAEVLGLELQIAESRADLKAILRDCDEHDRVLVDSGGANPYDFHELKELAEFAGLIELEPVLVYPAGCDPQEAGEIAQAFSFIGVQKMVITRLDVAKRFGSLLNAAHTGQLVFTHASSGEKVLEHFEEMTPRLLARLLMDYRNKRL